MSRWLIVMVLMAAVTTAVTLAVWFNRADWLPEDVPTHWGPSGEPDAFVPRESVFWYLMIVPLMMDGFVVLALLLPWLSPRNFKIEPFGGTYWYIMGLLSVMFAYMQVVILLTQMGRINNQSLPVWLVGGILLFMALLGNVLGRVRRNFWVGVRTPWTLASDQVWTQTHRLAAWLFVGGSVLGLVLLLLGLHPLIALVPFFVAALVPIFYSLWLYKRLEREGRLDKVDATADAGPAAH
jgi:uncharacterized membrane protein